MKFHMALGVIVWVMIAVWLVRLSLGLDHPIEDQIRVMLVCGSVGGLAIWDVIDGELRRSNITLGLDDPLPLAEREAT